MRVGDEPRADASETRSESRNEREHRLAHVAFVAAAIRLEPLASIVAPQTVPANLVLFPLRAPNNTILATVAA